MTTFHDPQPQSRRAVRQSERAETAESPAAFTQQETAAPRFYSGPNESTDPASPGPSTLWRSVRADVASPPTRVGRRAAVPVVVEQVPEEPVAQEKVAEEQAAEEPVAQEHPVREPVAIEPVALEPAVTEPAMAEVRAPQQFLSRRELRARQRAEEAGLVIDDRAPVDAAPVTAAEPAIPADRAIAVESVPFPTTPFDSLFQRHGDAPYASPDAHGPASPGQAASAEVDSPVSVETPASATPDLADAEFDSLTGATPRVDDPAIWSPPVGHWSTQADLDDESQDYRNPLGRRVGSGTVTTSALVLPDIPQGADIRGPLTGTGEIVLTGSIDLPLDLGSTGASDRFDDQDMDALFDANDAEVVSTNSAPVRAISAISTHSTGHGVTHTQKPKGTRALTGLVIASSSLAVIVAGLLVTAFAFNVF